MINREKVIKGLYAHGYRDCKSCPYWGSGENGQSICTQLTRDALALLKEQQEKIDRLLEEYASNAEMAEGLKELLKEQEEQEAVVRCKDCWKHSYDNCPFYERMDDATEDDFFCADGERKTNCSDIPNG